MKPLFYAVRRISRGPRGGLQGVAVRRTVITSLARAIDIAKREPADGLNEIDVVAITIRKDAFAVAEKMWSSRG